MKLIRILSSLAGAGIMTMLTLALVSSAQEPNPEPAPAAEAESSASAGEESELRDLTAAVRGDETVAGSDSEIVIGTAEVEEIIGEFIEAMAEKADPDTEATVDETLSEHEGDEEEKSSGREYLDEFVRFGGDAILRENQEADNVVAIFGNAIVEGKTHREVVAILGNVTINGESGRETVAVLGDVTINGRVDREVVAILGNVQLGPEAVVGGEVVSVGGVVDRAPGAKVDGPVRALTFIGGDLADGLKAWVHHCLIKLRPLAIADNLGWLWAIMLVALGFYLLLALMLPEVVRHNVQTMEKHPGMSLLSAVLTVLITPIAMIVLSVTVVGPAILGLLLLGLGIFGKVVFLAWLGRLITRPAGWTVPAVAVLIGGVITLGIYLVPILGFAFQKFSGFLGTGIVIYTIIMAMQANANAPTTPPDTSASGTVPPPTPQDPAAGSVAGTELRSVAAGGSVISDAASAPAAAVPPPPPPPAAAAGAEQPSALPQLSTLPRAGFWARLVATFVDVIAVGIFVGITGLGDYFVAVATIYFILMWGLKGTTLGGVVMGLKLVRTDDRPVDWVVGLVRSLGAFLSLFVLGLGFLWVAWDPQRQSWHDKIAGTTIVKMPKGVSLI